MRPRVLLFLYLISVGSSPAWGLGVWDRCLEFLPIPRGEFQRLSSWPDPRFNTGQLEHIRPRLGWNRVSVFEAGVFPQLFQAIPDFCRRVGFEMHRDGSVTYPQIAGFNARILEWRASGDPQAPHFLLWSDPSSGGTPTWLAARAYAAGYIPVSQRGRGPQDQELHYHDLFVHLIPYLLLSEATAGRMQRLFQRLVTLHDSPALREHAAFQERLEAVVEELLEVKLEISSLNLGRYLALSGRGGDFFRTLGELEFSLAHAAGRLRGPWVFTPAQQDAFDRS